jgi:trehalose/maltose hydrolase-like predicted phosphorylase
VTQIGSTSNCWQIREQNFSINDIHLYETLFALGNGYLGMRGTFEEGLGDKALEGTYINGFFESAPIIYGEKFIGYAENKQTILNLANAKVIRLVIGEQDDQNCEEFNLINGKILSYQRTLDMSDGVLRRNVRWQSPSGKEVQLDIERLVLQTHHHVALIRYQLTPLNFDGSLTLISGIDGAIRQGEHAEGDPRLGTQFSGDVLQLQEKNFITDTALMMHRTVNTGFSVACGVKNILDTNCSVEMINNEQFIGLVYRTHSQRGKTITLDKYMVYATSLDTEFVQLVPTIAAKLEETVQIGYENLYNAHKNYLTEFWESADITIEGNETMQRGIRFNLFHLLQSTGRDGRTNTAAKGLTGLGYEGHYFWDTEIYILPFFLYTQPKIARKLMEYRYHILNKARERARQMAHPCGALYAWRTINGEECSANFPTGTAQYHINADIAFAIQRYFDATQDGDFMKQYGAEILCETARLWLDVGEYIPTRGNRFCINGVTGPDEYQILVNNNAYTNLMARENLRYACEMLTWLRKTDTQAYETLTQKINLKADELMDWQEAADMVYIPYDEERGIIPQDDAFLSKPVWDFEHTPHRNYPLLLHYHPLVVTRYQVCKQADLILAEFLLNDQFDREQKMHDYHYYEPLTTHDSSLSGSIFGIMAAELGNIEKAYRYYTETATMDLENKHGNTQTGIHTANMAGAWQGIVFGFAGMRAKEGLSFNPTIPKQWRSYTFKVRYRGSLLSVRVTPGGASFKLLAGEPIEIRVNNQIRKVESQQMNQ